MPPCPMHITQCGPHTTSNNWLGNQSRSNNLLSHVGLVKCREQMESVLSPSRSKPCTAKSTLGLQQCIGQWYRQQEFRDQPNLGNFSYLCTPIAKLFMCYIDYSKGVCGVLSILLLGTVVLFHCTLLSPSLLKNNSQHLNMHRKFL